MLWAVALGAFVAGCAWRAWTHRCRAVDVHDLDAAYARGLQDGYEQGREMKDMDALERQWRIS